MESSLFCDACGTSPAAYASSEPLDATAIALCAGCRARGVREDALRLARAGVFVHLTERTDDGPPPCPFCNWALDLHGPDGSCPDAPEMSGSEAARRHEAHEAARQSAGCGPVIAPADDSKEPY